MLHLPWSVQFNLSYWLRLSYSGFRKTSSKSLCMCWSMWRLMRLDIRNDRWKGSQLLRTSWKTSGWLETIITLNCFLLSKYSNPLEIDKVFYELYHSYFWGEDHKYTAWFVALLHLTLEVLMKTRETRFRPSYRKRQYRFSKSVVNLNLTSELNALEHENTSIYLYMNLSVKLWSIY